ncbi:DUF423 domain-containing protein [Allosphingosinicella indica]|uniref:Uncharacterized membrane protein YgdD, TMEM256/DUF423 family n=1 Tax=Allosphingosinicella indica TaxID=941907 RepID=A0A1X7G098_9SPHN|nr:DUF423 domain-containing protein [Allosphingosinicella indica]SMF61775.1 Uncharacterized membrane protein YgdD, TMEM256/DUF423 family [Allosphingosinicella indica]
MNAAAPRVAAAGAVLVAFGIVLGAFGAHALKARLGPDALGWWQTAVDYQIWNALGLVALGAILRPALPAALIGVGVVIFSGSLYLMAHTDLRWLGAVTPLGGLLMIAGWTLAALRLARG